MVTNTNDKPPAGTTQATATAFAAPTMPSGPAADVPAGDAAAKLLEQPSPQAVTGSGERAADAAEQQTAAMARAAQEQANQARVTEAAKGDAAAAEITASLPSVQAAPASGASMVPVPGDVVTGDGSGTVLPPIGVPSAPLEDPAAAMPAPGDAAALQAPTAPVPPNPAAMPAVTGVGDSVTTKTGRQFTGDLARLWSKLKEGATHAELRAASGIHDVESHLRRWEAEGLARITSQSAPGGIIWRAREQGEA